MSMNEAIQSPAPSRRALFGGAAAMLTGGASIVALGASETAGGNPDAELIALCAEFERCEEAINDFYSHGRTPIEDDQLREAAQDPLWQRQCDLADKIDASRASTLEGARARARAIVTYNGGDFVDAYLRKLGVDGVLLAALIRDLAG